MMKSANSRQLEGVAGMQKVMDIIGRDPSEMKLYK